MRRRVLNWAFRSGLRKGFAEGSGPWLVVAIAAGAVKFLNRPSKHDGERMYLHLRPGDRYTITCADER